MQYEFHQAFSINPLKTFWKDETPRGVKRTTPRIRYFVQYEKGDVYSRRHTAFNWTRGA